MNFVQKSLGRLTANFVETRSKAESKNTAQLPKSYELSDMSLECVFNQNAAFLVKSIALIGAFHDRCGNLFKDDQELIENILSFLAQKNIHPRPDTRILPMNLT
ncbi:MAG: hypothetical protein AAF204_04580, partial [Pseudomonadota bacterium]